MSGLPEIRALYDAYLETALALEADRKPGQGLLGFGKKPADDPCHPQFAEDLRVALAELEAEDPDSARRRAVLELILFAPTEHREPLSVYWMLVAVHGLTPSLIRGLDPADAAALGDRYGKTYPRWERLPIQKDVFRALKQQMR